MTTLLHASDLHFGPPYDEEAGRALGRAAERLEPDAIVVSGDFTQRAKVRQYRAAREYLDTLPPVPLVVTPGNHDVPLYRIWERLAAPYRNYRRYIDEELDTVTRIEGATLVALNTAAPYTAITNGRIRPRQLEFAAEAFSEAPTGDVRIVVAHHHLAPAPDYEGGDVIPRAKRALDAFHSAGVELLLGGHLHRAYIGNSLDVHPGMGRRHGIVIVQCGTTTSRRGRARERARNSLNLIRLSETRVRVTHWMYADGIGDFRPFSRHVFPRRAHPFLEEEQGAPVGDAAAVEERA